MSLMRSLGDCSETIMGQAPPGIDCNKSGEGIPFVKAGEFGIERPIIREWTTNPLKMAERDDVLICVVGATSGKINRGENCAIGRSVAAIRANKELLDINYLYFFLKSWSTRLLEMSQGAAQTVITKSMLHNLQIALPPIDQQKKIAAILDAADEYRQKTKALIAKYDEFLQAIIYECLGDAINKDLKALKSGVSDFLPNGFKWFELRDITEAIADIDHKMPKSVDQGKLFLSAKDLSDDGELDFSAPKYISEEDFKNLSRKIKPEKGDIIYSRIGAKLGKARLVKTDHDFIVSYSCCTIRPIKEKVSALYLRYILDSEVTLRQASHGTKSIGVPDLGMNEIRSFKIPVPDSENMQLIEDKLRYAEIQKAQAQASLEKAEELFNSLLQKAFKGELV